MAEATVLMTIDSGVALVTLNRPQARNALDTAIVRDLQNALAELAALPDLRACVLTGAGSAFSAGADLKERQRMTLGEQERSTREIRRCADLLEELPVPTIAAINGAAYAGGLELAIACDIRMASAMASFAFPEVKVGIFPGAGGPIRLPGLVGSGWARLMVFCGDPLNAEEALRVGLVELVVTHERLTEESLALARRIAANGAEGVRAVKQLMNRACGMPYAEAAALSDSLRAPLNRLARWEAGLTGTGRRGEGEKG